MHYRCYWNIYLAIVIVAFVTSIINGNRGVTSIDDLLIREGAKGGLAMVRGRFYVSFFVILAMSSPFFTSLSFRSIGGGFSIREMMTPVSTLERYIFALLNSTVVCWVAMAAVSAIAFAYCQTNYLFAPDGSGYAFVGPLYFGSLERIPAEYEQRSILNFFDLLLLCDKEPMIRLFTLYISLTVASVLMWGRVTFKRFGVVVSAILHALVIAVLIYLADMFHDHLRTVFYSPYQGIRAIQSSGETTAKWVAFVGYIPAIVYQWVVWKKLKRVQITK